jgi:hypothetical protein
LAEDLLFIEVGKFLSKYPLPVLAVDVFGRHHGIGIKSTICNVWHEFAARTISMVSTDQSKCVSFIVIGLVYTLTTQEVLAERLGALSLLTRSGVLPLSSSAAGLLKNPCHPGRGLVLAKPGIPWFTPKKSLHSNAEFIKQCLMRHPI